MKISALNFIILATLTQILIGCNDGGQDRRETMDYSVRFEATDDMLSDETFSPSPCEDASGDEMCATPSEYTLGLDSVNLVTCGGTCTVGSDRNGFSNDRGSLDFESSTTPAPVIAGSTYKTTGKRDSGFVSARGVTFNFTYIQVVFPDNASVEAAFRGATLKLCLKANCETGASRGDYLTKLDGETAFKWYNLDTEALVSTRPSNPLKESSIASGSSTTVGFSSTQTIYPVLLSENLTPSAGTPGVVVKVDVGRTLYCDDSFSMANGICEPSEGELFWIHFPPDTFELSLE